MSSSLPTPVAAVLGIVPTLAARASRVPAKMVQLPLLAISHALTTVEVVQRNYDELAERGESLVRRLRGQAEETWDETEDRVEDAADRFEDAADRFAARAKQAGETAGKRADQLRATAQDRVDEAGDTLRSVASTATRSLGERAEQAEQVVERTADKVTPFETNQTETDQTGGDQTETDQAGTDQTPEPEQPKGHATPKATEPDATRVDTAVSPQVETVVEAAVAPLGDEVPDKDDLPLPDYDHMTLGSLRGRLRSLSLAQLGQVRAYEKEHADRLPVVTMLDNRIAKLAADPSAAPVGAPSTAPAPEQQAAAGGGGSKVSPSTAATPSGPATDSAPSRPLN